MLNLYSHHTSSFKKAPIETILITSRKTVIKAREKPHMLSQYGELPHTHYMLYVFFSLFNWVLNSLITFQSSIEFHSNRAQLRLYWEEKNKAKRKRQSGLTQLQVQSNRGGNILSRLEKISSRSFCTTYHFMFCLTSSLHHLPTILCSA
jgi:hypothetical protein